MDVMDAVIVVTGAGSGIGAALARRFAAEGAAAVVVADRDAQAAQAVAAEIGGVAEALDVTDAAAVADLVARTEQQHGRIDLFCSNAGIATGTGVDGSDGADDEWRLTYEVHVMAHVYAARAVLPGMLARGRGYLLNTASAAGLLTAPGDAAYSASKHAAVGLAQWLAVEYGDRGIGVSVLCPQGVSTPLLMDPLAAGNASARAVAAAGQIITPDQVADAVISGLASERFLILPHPEVATYWAQLVADPDRWLAGVRRMAAAAR
jgi:NAD(P)-dependent dehydrogenase (short-subunit alcohol dehydrogenase family)